jgi:hypothetical protein
MQPVSSCQSIIKFDVRSAQPSHLNSELRQGDYGLLIAKSTVGLLSSTLLFLRTDCTPRVPERSGRFC